MKLSCRFISNRDIEENIFMETSYIYIFYDFAGSLYGLYNVDKCQKKMLWYIYINTK